jgi:transcriptional regulator with XRE-family HTH domain
VFLVNINRTPVAERIALAIPEQRRDLGLSERELARLAGVSRWQVARLERGEPVDPAVMVTVAAALTIVELYRDPPPSPPPKREEPLLHDLRPVLRQGHRRSPYAPTVSPLGAGEAA